MHSIFVIGFNVGRVAFEEKPWIYVIYVELYLNLVFAVDMVKNFTQPIVQESGKINWNRKQIIKKYIFGWFIFDIFAFFPLAYFRYNSNRLDGSKDSLKNVMQLNFEALPRAYKMFLLMQMSRGRYAREYMRLALKKLDYQVEVQMVWFNFFELVFILHVTGCLWYSASYGNINSNVNWVTTNEVQDQGLFSKYILSFYWAIVTCTTIGYGDILPTNNYELLWALLTIIFGVAIFAFILSNLSS